MRDGGGGGHRIEEDLRRARAESNLPESAVDAGFKMFRVRYSWRGALTVVEEQLMPTSLDLQLRNDMRFPPSSPETVRSVTVSIVAQKRPVRPPRLPAVTRLRGSQSGDTVTFGWDGRPPGVPAAPAHYRVELNAQNFVVCGDAAVSAFELKPGRYHMPCARVGRHRPLGAGSAGELYHCGAGSASDLQPVPRLRE